MARSSLEDVLELDDPVARFIALGELGDGARELTIAVRTERGRVVRELRARAPQPSWGEIGALLGISGERARQLADDDKENTTQ